MTDWEKDIQGEFGSDVFKAGVTGDVISSGSFIVDYLSGVGGLPLGTIIEILGSEGSGKTTLALTALKNAIDEDRPHMYLDYESTISDEYLGKLGIPVKKFSPYHLLPKTMEDGFMMMLRFCERFQGGLIVTDSIAAMPPVSDIEKMAKIIGQVKVASQAHVMSQALRQMCSVFQKSNNCCVFLNQERSNIDVLGRGLGGKTSPGGAAVKFYSSLRLQLEMKPPAIKEEVVSPLTGKKIEQIVALNIEVRVLKNRLAPSFRKGRIILRMDEGIDDITPAIWIAEHLGLVRKSGAYYTLDEQFSGEVLGGKRLHGFDRVRNFFLQDPQSRYKLMENVKSFLRSQIQNKEVSHD